MDPETLEQVGQGAISVAASVSVGLSGAAVSNRRESLLLTRDFP